jgi:hypothetical protein
MLWPSKGEFIAAFFVLALLLGSAGYGCGKVVEWAVDNVSVKVQVKP